MSDTPLTDAVAKRLVGYPFSNGDHPLVDHARRLERALKVAEDALQACKVGCSITGMEEVAKAIAEEQAAIAKLKEGAK